MTSFTERSPLRQSFFQLGLGISTWSALTESTTLPNLYGNVTTKMGGSSSSKESAQSES